MIGQELFEQLAAQDSYTVNYFAENKNDGFYSSQLDIFISKFVEICNECQKKGTLINEEKSCEIDTKQECMKIVLMYYLHNGGLAEGQISYDNLRNYYTANRNEINNYVNPVLDENLKLIDDANNNYMHSLFLTCADELFV